MDGLVNWESSQLGDSERFSQETHGTNGNKNLKSYDVYLKQKEIRATSKKLTKEKVANLNKKTLEKELSTT